MHHETVFLREKKRGEKKNFKPWSICNHEMYILFIFCMCQLSQNIQKEQTLAQMPRLFCVMRLRHGKRVEEEWGLLDPEMLGLINDGF